MSVRGIGTDIVAVDRVRELLNRHGDRFLARCFQPQERARIQARHGPAREAMVAGRWAAKEAFLKALGGSIAHIPYQDIAVSSAEAGAPLLSVTGLAAEALNTCGGRKLHLTISHERQFAVATVLIED
ncbi:MAG: holo-ACP synthase [Candidatus Krumholzibacteria bacterium]|nr:holo-ACP synthase [Candidatus Krumholzibacteria bacterium]